MDLSTAMLVLTTAVTLSRLLPVRLPERPDDDVLSELTLRRGFERTSPTTARGWIGGLSIALRRGGPGSFLSIELSGRQPARMRLRGRSDAAHPVLRAFGSAVGRQVVPALEIDATLSGGLWRLQIWEPLHAVAADRLLGIVLGAAEALANLPEEHVDWAIVTYDPDPSVRRQQLSTAISARRAPLDWLLVLARTDVPEVALIAASAAGEAARDHLLALLDDPYVAERAALALSHLAPGPESHRVEAMLLSGAETGDLDAIDALARYGSIRAIPLLHRLEGRALGLSDVARHARLAIDAIHARAGEPGRLSIARNEGGELSLS